MTPELIAAIVLLLTSFAGLIKAYSASITAEKIKEDRKDTATKRDLDFKIISQEICHVRQNSDLQIKAIKENFEKSEIKNDNKFATIDSKLDTIIYKISESKK